MLQIKRVEMQGFKSFVDRTEMRFAGAGIAAIVGPNGCGKSNLGDAISWVLGEQSAKSLRGSRMEDVIFAGTRDRKPVGMASVTLTLVDPQWPERKKALAAIRAAEAKAAAEAAEAEATEDAAAIDATAAIEATAADGEAAEPVENGNSNGQPRAEKIEAVADTEVLESVDGPAPANGHVNGHSHTNGHDHAPANGHANGNSHANGNGHKNGHANGQSAGGPANGRAPILEDRHAEGHGTPHGLALISRGQFVDDLLDATNGEISVTRRLFRSGESEYIINGKIARLRDIQEIFTGTGLGPESYAIIEQGRIGQILSNKPQDRRAVIEEAAGVTKFKTRKRLAEAKLEGAKQNLSRVFDILEEVSRQVNSLKRQASKARRYEEMRTEMLAFLRTAVIGRYRIIEKESAKLALDLGNASNEFQWLSEQLSGKEKAYEELHQQFFTTEKGLTESRAKLSEAKLEAERTRSKLDVQAKEATGLEQRLASGQTETSNLTARVTALAEELASQTERVTELNRAAEEARGKLGAKNQERDALVTRVRERESEIERTRQSVLRLLGEASTLKNQLAKVDEYLASVDRDSTRTQRDEETATAEVARLEAVKEDLSQKLAARQLDLQSTSERRKAVESDLSARKQSAAEARRKLDEMKAELARQEARRNSLDEVIAHRSYTTEAVKRLFAGVESGGSTFKPVGVLADFLEVNDATFERAVEEFLHDELEYIVVKGWDQAESGVEFMRAGADGHATFLVEPPVEWVAPDRTAEQAEGVMGRLRDVVRFTNGLSSQSHILARLSNCFLVADRAAGRSLAQQHPDSFFLTPEGISYHGLAVSGGKKSGAGPLALKRELRELNEFVLHRQSEVAMTAARLEGLEGEIQGLSEELERLRQQQQSQEKDALVLDQEFRKLTEEFTRTNQRLSVARLELDRLRKENERSRETKERNLALVAEKEEARQKQEEALEAARQDLVDLQAAAARAVEEHAAIRAELAAFEERRRSETDSKNRLERQISESNSRIHSLAAEIERWTAHRATLLTSNSELDGRIAELGELIEAKGGEVAGLAETLEAQRTDLAALEESLKQLRQGSQSAQEKRQLSELELVKRQAALKYLEETARKDLGTEPSELAAADDNEIAEEALTEAEEKSQEIRTRIDALGPVNPQALEEFQEAQQRYDFLNAQRQDLLDSIRDTEKALHEIDVESRRRFVEAFEAINANFREKFKTLFGGGTGEMRLTDESNTAESGIDIVASPPGKKLQNVLLLSGGEKSLTAMALLMAIFRYQPSPFCVLDEVDAPLDEPNTVRLTHLLREMAKQTQFIVITHAKRTMEIAQSMYGVTMQEPGVSRLVSVKFSEPAPPLPVPEPVIANAASA